jgi:hypothetical protein
MSHVQKQVDRLREQGIYTAQQVDPSVINRIINMEEWEYYALEIQELESYLGLLAQQVYYIQQECNIAEAREIESSNSFKIEALPYVVKEKIRSVEERWIFASSINDDLKKKFEQWQDSIIDSTLKKDLAEPVIEKLNVLKKIYDDRRIEGKNRNLHKYTDGGT